MLGMSILGNLIVVDELTVSKLLKNTEKKCAFGKYQMIKKSLNIFIFQDQRLASMTIHSTYLFNPERILTYFYSIIESGELDFFGLFFRN